MASVSRITGEEFEELPPDRAEHRRPTVQPAAVFEPGRRASRLQQELEADFPGEDVRVVPGDCNETIPEVLAELKSLGVAWAPTFAFLDPDGAELDWATIAAARTSTLADGYPPNPHAFTRPIQAVVVACRHQGGGAHNHGDADSGH